MALLKGAAKNGTKEGKRFAPPDRFFGVTLRPQFRLLP
jgi:hypothetical protein